MSQQLDHLTIPFSTEKFPVTLITDQVKSPANLGSILRLADAFCVEKIIFCGIDEEVINSNRLKRTARATQQTMHYCFEDNIIDVVNSLQQQNYSLTALEITDDSIAVEDFIIKKDLKIALVIGDENFGVSAEILQKTEQNIHITMFGNNSSMNVAQATGIALYEITKKIKSVQQK